MLNLDIKERFEGVQRRIRHAEADAGRPMNSVGLIAVSKTQPAEAIREVYALGQRDFGENYLQEALAKQEELADLDDIVWHFIGPIQSNKTRPIAEHFDWVHSVDRIKTAERLDQQRPAHLPPLNICIQVNVSGESTKSGAALSELADLSDRICQLHRLHLRGLMAIPAPIDHSDDDQGKPFRLLREASENLPKPLDSLSMGMSDDLESAILEGATWVRIGTALFGPRRP
jgi:pyridoxal phosphate enzyme (YggS family)